MTKSIKLFFFLFVVASEVVYSQSADFSRRWGLEAELVQPFLPQVGIMRINATRSIAREGSKLKGDLLLGMYIRPNVAHDVVEKINEYMVAIGYRQYFWRGFHLEAKANIGYAWGTKNLIDGKDYQTSTIFWESNLGYKFILASRAKRSWYLIPQFGMLGNAKGENTINIGPRGGKPDTFIQGNLLVGVNF
jgi:hypothetical protein